MKQALSGSLSALKDFFPSFFQTNSKYMSSYKALSQCQFLWGVPALNVCKG